MSKEEYLFKIDVMLDENIEIKGNNSSVCMILFHGRLDSSFFTGEILPGAADTQTESSDGKRLLSARYIIKGHDADGNECSIFVENNGEVAMGKEIVTCPRFVTDSKSLKWLEERNFTGKIAGKSENEIEIQIYEV